MKVKLIDLYSQYSTIQNEIDSAIQNVIRDSAYINGPFNEKFEREFASYIGVRHCIGVANGTDALYIALRSLGIGPGDEIITAANTFIATSEAIQLTGARAVFVDCNPTLYTIDPKKIERAITPRTKAIIPVHLYGHPANMDEISSLAKKNNLMIIEDVAQAHGAEYKGKKVGTFGIISCFSFFPGKNLGAYGDGGAIVTDDDELAVKTRMCANHGRRGKYEHEFEGVNSRLDGIQAAILSVKLPYLDSWIERKKAIASLYTQELQDIVETPLIDEDVRHAFHLYVIRAKQRDELRTYLSENGIDTGIHYPTPLPFLPAYKYRNHRYDEFPVCVQLKDEILSLPLYSEMTDEQIYWITYHIKKFYGKN